MLNSDFQATLRRLKPEKRQAQLKPRAESDLDFIETTGNKPGKLLYDTVFYSSYSAEPAVVRVGKKPKPWPANPKKKQPKTATTTTTTATTTTTP